MNSLIVFIILSVQNQSPFTIYNASAGSGKTYALVKNYLKILFQSYSFLSFRTILALTFTNKAVGEMKERIINTLKAFADESIVEQSHPMFDSISIELQISPQNLHETSKTLLHTIVHNYAAFDISTIDKFNHKLIRTFAHDLKLPVNFEVELDTKKMLAKAVDKLIDSAGKNKELTKLLVDFAIEKTNDNKSWDITYDFNAISELLISENDIWYINQLKDKSVQDFKALESNLRKEIKLLETQIISFSKETLSLISSNNLNFEDFSRQTLPNHFKKASELKLSGLYDNKLEINLAQGIAIYNKTLDTGKATTIDALLPQIQTHFLAIKKLVYGLKFYKNALGNIIPLSVLGAIKKTLDLIKQEDNLLLISEFNSIIYSEISKQPSPFIYERIGEKFKHYFIDEFQDTSKLQWENLVPLIANAISNENLRGETGSAMLVGDAKQAIYRWRGGHAEQFIDLYSKSTTPFVIQQNVKDLPSNYRSQKAIIEFNNAFFNHISDFVFTDEKHSKIYKNARQEIISNKEGYVELSFLDVDKNDKNDSYCEAVLSKIHTAKNHGFSLKDVCIIVRKKKEGVTIAEYLKENHIPIVSSETLLLKNAPEVNFIVHIMGLAVQPKNDEIKIQVLSFLTQYKLKLQNDHDFFSSMIKLSGYQMFESLNDFGFDFSFKTLLQLPIYESIEAVIRGFKLNQTSNAYLQFFLDEVLDFSQKNTPSIADFLTYWERKKDSLSLVSSEGENAVHIMTIHKSKGLEFPVVIFPYANQDVYFDIRPKIWFPVDETDFNGFSNLYLNLNKDLEHYSTIGTTIYNAYQSSLELDSINLLYVVLTRAIEHLYIISEYDLDRSKTEKLNLYSGLFIHYLKSKQLWGDNSLTYTFGKPERSIVPVVSKQNTVYQEELISTAKEDNNLSIVTNSGYLWDSSQEKAIERGNLIHNIMAEIKTKDDVSYALNSFVNAGKISASQLSMINDTIQNIVNQTVLAPLFDSDLTIYNEKDIITKSGEILRPDRLVIKNNKDVTIIDYKTGLMNSKHKEQLFDYQLVLEDMSFNISKKILVYINDDITIKEF